ncbi:hypothetical protein [Streptomyces shenzhenensis]|uniref:hypothetical protein n=1 Tax=Streptomyces shenzhenensis TaxID=943815 RepID=UPI0027E4DC82|nr:hypothetical protein [Streptomyces shenzhenensis]
MTLQTGRHGGGVPPAPDPSPPGNAVRPAFAGPGGTARPAGEQRRPHRPRRRGPATRLVRAVAAGVRERGGTAFPHAAPSCANAVRPDEPTGFTERLRGRTLLPRGPGTTTKAGLL